MIKTIAVALVGTFIAAATPAAARPGPAFQSAAQSGVKLGGVTLRGVSVYGIDGQWIIAPQRAPSPTMPAPLDAELAGKPVQVACVNNCGGIRFNGISWNGLKWNGVKLQGIKLNGSRFNGWSLNGRFLNGRLLNNGAAAGAGETIDAQFTVGAVTLPDGARIVVR